MKEKYLADAVSEYAKRLSRYCQLEIIEIADEKTPDGASETVPGIPDYESRTVSQIRAHALTK